MEQLELIVVTTSHSWEYKRFVALRRLLNRKSKSKEPLVRRAKLLMRMVRYFRMVRKRLNAKIIEQRRLLKRGVEQTEKIAFYRALNRIMAEYVSFAESGNRYLSILSQRG